MPPTASTDNPLNSGTPAVTALIEALGRDRVLTGDELRDRPCRDWSEEPSAQPLALLLPRSPQEVAAALHLCHAHGAPVVVQGGLTGLAGGANPAPGEIALSLARLNAIEDFDPEGGTVIAQAGVTLQQLQEHVGTEGWSFPLDLGARGSCQLGGNAATNAGGNRVLRHGMMRQNVLGLEVAMADGTLVDMLDRVIKNNAGFDLKQLFIGSEGTLGIITRLSLKLEPARRASSTALCGIRSFQAATRLLRLAKEMLPGLTAYELMWDGFFRASAQAQGRRLPLDGHFPLYVLLESEGHAAPVCDAAMQEFLASALEDGCVEDAVIASSIEQAAGLWGFREGIAELLAHLKPCVAFDVSVTLVKMNDLVEELQSDLEARFPRSAHLFFGHLGDGNLHLISGPYARPEDKEAVERLVYARVGRYRGSISAEHGVGRLKKAYLPMSRTAEELALMARLRNCLDPQGILNRGRVLDA